LYGPGEVAGFAGSNGLCDVNEGGFPVTIDACPMCDCDSTQCDMGPCDCPAECNPGTLNEGYDASGYSADQPALPNYNVGSLVETAWLDNTGDCPSDQSCYMYAGAGNTEISEGMLATSEYELYGCNDPAALNYSIIWIT
jgi:hypothetical protein